MLGRGVEGRKELERGRDLWEETPGGAERRDRDTERWREVAWLRKASWAEDAALTMQGAPQGAPRKPTPDPGQSASGASH